MNNKTVVYDRKKHNTADIVDFHNECFDVLCSVCKAKLIFILSLEEAKIKAPGHPGIFCPNSPDHVYTTFNFGSRTFWKDFDEEVVELKTKNMREKGYTEKQIQEHLAKHYPDVS